MSVGLQSCLVGSVSLPKKRVVPDLGVFFEDKQLLPGVAESLETKEFQEMSTLIGAPILAAALALPPPQTSSVHSDSMVRLAGEIGSVVMGYLMRPESFQIERDRVYSELVALGFSDRALAYPGRSIREVFSLIRGGLQKEFHEPPPEYLKPFFVEKTGVGYVLNEPGMLMQVMLNEKNVDACALFFETNIFLLMLHVSQQIDQGKAGFLKILQQTIDVTNAIIQSKMEGKEFVEPEPQLADFALDLESVLFSIAFPEGAESIVLPECLQSIQPELFFLFSTLLLEFLKGGLANAEAALPAIIEFLLSRVTNVKPQFVGAFLAGVREKFEKMLLENERKPIPQKGTASYNKLVKKLSKMLAQQHEAEISLLSQSVGRVVSGVVPELANAKFISQQILRLVIKAL